LTDTTVLGGVWWALIRRRSLSQKQWCTVTHLGEKSVHYMIYFMHASRPAPIVLE